jgi:hypothetical protein
MESPCASYRFFCSSFSAVRACCCITFFWLIASITAAGARSSFSVNCRTRIPYVASRSVSSACTRATTCAFRGPMISAIGSLPTTSCSACRIDCFT